MDKLLKNPISIFADFCLIAFLVPGHVEQWPNGQGYHILLGLLQPGWCRVEIDPPPLNGVAPGIFFEVSFAWGLLLVFAIAKFIAIKQTGIGDDNSLEDYRRNSRRARY